MKLSGWKSSPVYYWVLDGRGTLTIVIHKVFVLFWGSLKNYFVHKICEYIMGKKYGSHILNHCEGAGTLQTKVPCGSRNDFALNAVGNWSNELVGFKHLWILWVNESYHSELNHANQNHNYVLFIVVSVNAYVYHQPDYLGHHQNKTYHKQALFEQRFPMLWWEKILCLMSFFLDLPTLPINVVVKVYCVYWAQLNILEIKVGRLERSIVVIHETLSFHFGNFVIKAIDCALVSTSTETFFIFSQVFKILIVMEVIWTTLVKGCN